MKQEPLVAATVSQQMHSAERTNYSVKDVGRVVYITIDRKTG